MGQQRPVGGGTGTGAPLSGLLGVGPAEVLYTNGRKSDNGGKKSSGKNNGGKSKNFNGKEGGGSGHSGDSTNRGLVGSFK
ncbi:hypothetical protein CRG98_048309 [Punica granatum]|uniref:Uncharacterized protein n=1 Tax=Punica granatum TaxID=22663 RepID=A0A2I0HIG9_PUNGR|nr:hypothetical protein CRG98_048309 [Punica granatum]